MLLLASDALVVVGSGIIWPDAAADGPDAIGRHCSQRG